VCKLFFLLSEYSPRRSLPGGESSPGREKNTEGSQRQLETVSIAEPLQNRQHAQNPLLPIRAKFGVLEQTQGLHLQAKLHLNVFIVSASGGQKPQFWANFDTFGGSCTDPLLSIHSLFAPGPIGQ